MAITTREPNTIHTVNGFYDVADQVRPVQITKTWNLGHAEMMEMALALQAREDAGELPEHMRYFAWLLGTEGIEITITQKWEA